MLCDGNVRLRPIRTDDLGVLVEMTRLPGVREWWGPAKPDGEARDDLFNEGSAWTLEIDGDCAGWLAVSETTDPMYWQAGLDIFLHPRHQGHGHGPHALRLAAGWLLTERGHHRLTIDPAADNLRAIRTYRSLGFRPVGLMRQYERGTDGTWHDGMLMDLLAPEFINESAPARHTG